MKFISNQSYTNKNMVLRKDATNHYKVSILDYYFKYDS
jgi:hypothetical protein